MMHICVMSSNKPIRIIWGGLILPLSLSPPAVCSSTIWMGHLAKSVTQEQVVQAFEDFGQVKSVEVRVLNPLQPEQFSLATLTFDFLSCVQWLV